MKRCFRNPLSLASFEQEIDIIVTGTRWGCGEIGNHLALKTPCFHELASSSLAIPTIFWPTETLKIHRDHLPVVGELQNAAPRAASVALPSFCLQLSTCAMDFCVCPWVVPRGVPKRQYPLLINLAKRFQRSLPSWTYLNES